jgi:predicted component of type VI protein secretion system
VNEVVFVEQAPEAGKEHVLTPGTTIGRENCDVTIPDPEISRRQAQVHAEGDAVAIEDLGSTNGTFVNGRQINGRETLQPGDEVRFGDTVWKLKPAEGATRIADRPIADAQVTRARAVPAPPPETPAPQAAAVGARGDVPAPDFQPSAIRRVVPPPDAPAAFTPSATSHRGGSAATRVSATIFCMLVVALTAAGVVIYYITEPFK